MRLMPAAAKIRAEYLVVAEHMAWQFMASKPLAGRAVDCARLEFLQPGVEIAANVVKVQVREFGAQLCLSHGCKATHCEPDSYNAAV